MQPHVTTCQEGRFVFEFLKFKVFEYKHLKKNEKNMSKRRQCYTYLSSCTFLEQNRLYFGLNKNDNYHKKTKSIFNVRMRKSYLGSTWQLIRPKRIYFPEHFCCCFSSNLCALNTTNTD
jgi:hypothetical protein